MGWKRCLWRPVDPPWVQILVAVAITQVRPLRTNERRRVPCEQQLNMGQSDLRGVRGHCYGDFGPLPRKGIWLIFQNPDTERVR